MAVNEREFKELRRQAEEAKTTRDRAAGQLEAAMARLLDEFGCKTLEEAETLLTKLEAEAATAEADYETEVAKFKETWGGHLTT